MISPVLRPMLENFANFVVLVATAGATYCRRKCFRTVLGRNVVVFKIRRTTATPVTCMVMRQDTLSDTS